MTKKKVRKVKAARPGEAGKASRGAGVETKSGTSAGTAAVKKSDAQAREPVGKVEGIKQFFADVRAEFDKVTWSNRKETVSLTIAVLAITIFFSSYLGLVDVALSKLVGTVIR